MTKTPPERSWRFAAVRDPCAYERAETVTSGIERRLCRAAHQELRTTPLVTSSAWADSQAENAGSIPVARSSRTPYRCLQSSGTDSRVSRVWCTTVRFSFLVAVWTSAL
jgi:hypothetical protein